MGLSRQFAPKVAKLSLHAPCAQPIHGQQGPVAPVCAKSRKTVATCTLRPARKWFGRGLSRQSAPRVARLSLHAPCAPTTNRYTGPHFVSGAVRRPCHINTSDCDQASAEPGRIERVHESLLRPDARSPSGFCKPGAMLLKMCAR
jgi:hypothetical protein